MQSESSSKPTLEELSEQFIQSLRDGGRPSIDALVGRYPQYEEKIQQLFPTLAILENLGPSDEARGGGPELGVPSDCPEELGEYRIVREVGRGGMGLVYEAEHGSLGRRVALKLLPTRAALDPVYLKRFQREARAAARLHHTNIVPVFEIGHHRSIYYYTMQFIDGQGLNEVFRELTRIRGRCEGACPTQGSAGSRLIAESLIAGHPPFAECPAPASDRSTTAADSPTESHVSAMNGDRLSESVVLDRSGSSVSSRSQQQYFYNVARLGVQVSEALAYAHSEKVLHRDIKPSNLILDSRGTVWVTDFGLAKDDKDNLTETGDLVGTLRYMAPERLRGREDYRSDIYSLGLTLYEFVTLRESFSAPDRARLLEEVAHVDPIAPRKLDRTIPKDLETIVLKAIHKDPRQRYQSADLLAEDLRLFLLDRPIRARRSSSTERFWRWCRRNPASSWLASMVIFLIATVTIVSVVMNIRLRAQVEIARRNQSRATIAERNALQARTDALHQLLQAKLAQANSARWSGRRGQRFQSLEVLASATKLAAQLRMGEEMMLKLRNEAIACAVLPDLRKSFQYPVNKSWHGGISFDSQFERFTQSEPDGTIVIRRISDPDEQTRLAGAGARAWVVGFSRDHRYLIAHHH